MKALTSAPVASKICYADGKNLQNSLGLRIVGASKNCPAAIIIAANIISFGSFGSPDRVERRGQSEAAVQIPAWPFRLLLADRQSSSDTPLQRQTDLPATASLLFPIASKFRADLSTPRASVRRLPPSARAGPRDRCCRWDQTFRTNIYSMFYLCKESIPRMSAGSDRQHSIDQLEKPLTQPAGLCDDQGRYCQLYGRPGADGREAGYPRELRGARLDPDAAHPRYDARGSGQVFRPEHAARPRRANRRSLHRLYVLLASSEGSYITGALIPVTGGRPML